uniref:Autophagy protein ATG5 UblA domain-containing protein n=1 Tax=Trypanosoma congolense (strain IL3000) TaxID=1068625 RepID=G0UNJ9_TRYCI|nr:conserved hypothetical protein [Trypanosoma congolense IL3000]
MSLQAEDYVGSVPVIISLSEMDCAVQEKPTPMSFLLPRTTVLMAVRGQVQKFFSPFTVVQEESAPLVWLTYKGEPLAWQYPVGALKDSIAALAMSNCNDAATGIRSGDVLTLPSPAEMNPTRFALPLLLEVRITSVVSDKPPAVPCPGQEDVVTGRNPDQAMRDYLKQMLKGTYSAMYGSIKLMMDARSEVINDMLNFATCIAVGEPLVQTLRAYNERLVALRRLAGSPSNIVVMMSAPFGNNLFRFFLSRVPIGELGGSRKGSGSPESLHDESSGFVPGSDSSVDVTAVADSYHKVTFGEVMWHVLLRPYFQWWRQRANAESVPEGAAPLYYALSPFYEGVDEASVIGGEPTSWGVRSALIDKFISSGDGVSDGGVIHATAPTPQTVKGSVCFIVQGTRPPLSTPVKYLLERFASADGRLYVSLALLG